MSDGDYTNFEARTADNGVLTAEIHITSSGIEAQLAAETGATAKSVDFEEGHSCVR